MVACSLSADPADHVSGYVLRRPNSQVGGHNATLLTVGKDHYGPVDRSHSVQWVVNRILMPLQARDCVLRGGGG